MRSIKKDYPKTARQVASYLQIDLDTFEVWCIKLDLEPCDALEGWQEPIPLYEIEAMIKVYQALETQTIDD